MSEENGFRISGEFYPWANDFRACDIRVMQDITGLSWKELLREWDGDDSETNPIVISAVVAASVWQKYPTRSRDDIARFAESLFFGDIEMLGDEEPESPKASESTSSESGSESTTPSGSKASQVLRSAPAIQVSTGQPR